MLDQYRENILVRPGDMDENLFSILQAKNAPLIWVVTCICRDSAGE